MVPPLEDQTGLMVLAMAAYIRNGREAGWAEAEIEKNLRGLYRATGGLRIAGRPPAPRRLQ